MAEALDLFYWMMWIVQAMRAVHLSALMLGWQLIIAFTLKAPLGKLYTVARFNHYVREWDSLFYDPLLVFFQTSSFVGDW